MNALGWSMQRRRVERLARFVKHQHGKDIRLRRALKRRFRVVMSRLDTLIMVGATGFVWTARLKDADGQSHPVRELLDAALLVRSWKWFASRLTRRVP
jgi:hypothetical protein